MESWNLNELEVLPHQPEVLDSESEGRAILINLPKGEQLQEHQVHERAWLLVIAGNVELNTPDGKWAAGGTGLLAEDANVELERFRFRASAETGLTLIGTDAALSQGVIAEHPVGLRLVDSPLPALESTILGDNSEPIQILGE